MRVLFVSRYCDPAPKASSDNVYRQALNIQRYWPHISAEVLTWPLDDDWHGPIPEEELQHPPMRVQRDGLTYHVFRAPRAWNANNSVLSDICWSQAVEYGKTIIEYLQPEVVHLLHRHGLWWLLESAQALGVPTVYSNHDWGIACVRTTLVMGSGALCDGVAEPTKCAHCVKSGRGVLGRVNEAVADTYVGKRVLATLEGGRIYNALTRKGVVTEDALSRSQKNHLRAVRVISRLSHCFTPSTFGKQFFCRLGCPSEKVSVLPWYCDKLTQHAAAPNRGPLIVTYVGRISPEKGVHLIFDALEQVKEPEPVILRLAGDTRSTYGAALRQRYASRVGTHQVEWLGWTHPGDLYATTDVAIIPSVWMDNTPFTLIEALAHNVPVISSQVPSISEYLQEGKTGFLASVGSSSSLAAAISRAVLQKHTIRSHSVDFPPQQSLRDYLERLTSVYHAVTSKKPPQPSRLRLQGEDQCGSR